MEDIVYKDMIIQEKEHWWFKARREILDSYLSSLNLPLDSSILEIGCGTGGNISMLQKYGKVSAIEMDEFAISYAKKTGATIRQGYLPDNFPFEEKFDLICMFDVLEHIEEDMETLCIIKEYLKPDALLIITVPAYQWLYSSHDRLLHHKRRYYKSDLIKKIDKSNLTILNFTFFNTLLFPLVIVARILDMFKFSNNSTGYKIPNKILNLLFYHIFNSEKKLLKFINFPFGTSLFILVKNKIK